MEDIYEEVGKRSGSPVADVRRIIEVHSRVLKERTKKHCDWIASMSKHKTFSGEEK